jgi:hypothetical protein
MALAVTFPFNITIGMPFYYLIIQNSWLYPKNYQSLNTTSILKFL